jgi:hypothetical protein
MRALASAVLSLLLSLSANATSFSTDATDLWWNPQESGWGVNVSQQSDTLFMTFFVYGPNGAPTWYVAPATVYESGAGLFFTGPLYQTAGPWFGTSFNPNNVTNRSVGSVYFRLNSVTSATLTYTVDGVSVSKSLSRQTWKAETFTGNYVGGSSGTLSGCAVNGTAEDVDVFSITQNGASFILSAANVQSNVACTYTGTYSQAGHLGGVTGNFECTNGTAGTFSLQELEGTLSGVTGRLATANGGCGFNGRIGGARRGS